MDELLVLLAELFFMFIEFCLSRFFKRSEASFENNKRYRRYSAYPKTSSEKKKNPELERTEDLIRQGAAEHTRSNDNKALSLYNEALEIAKKSDDKQVLGIGLENIGNAFLARKDLDNAYTY